MLAIIAVAPYAPDDNIHAWVKNVGLDPIYAIDKLDVLVTTPGTKADAMTYSTSGGDNTWAEDPLGTPWKPGYTLHIIITLPAGSPLAVSNHVLTISTPNGMTFDKSFSR